MPRDAAAGGLRRAVDRLVVAGGILAGIAIAAMMAAMCYEVAARGIFNSPTFWATEVAGYLLVASASLGLGYVLREHGHVAVDIVIAKFPARFREVVFQLNLAIVGGIGVAIVVLGWEEVARAARLGEISLTPLALPIAYPLAFVPVGAVLLALQAAAMMWDRWRQGLAEEEQ